MLALFTAASLGAARCSSSTLEVVYTCPELRWLNPMILILERALVVQRDCGRRCNLHWSRKSTNETMSIGCSETDEYRSEYSVPQYFNLAYRIVSTVALCYTLQSFVLQFCLSNIYTQTRKQKLSTRPQRNNLPSICPQLNK